MRPLTFAESVQLCLAGARIRDEIDAELGHLVQQLAGGRDGLLPAIHDRLNILGDFANADRVRALVSRDRPQGQE